MSYFTRLLFQFKLQHGGDMLSDLVNKIISLDVVYQSSHTVSNENAKN